MKYIGIDLGTSAVKLQLTEADGRIVAAESRAYGVRYPHPGWSEQDPADWKTAVFDGIRALVKKHGGADIAAIAAAGQMHGLVTLDAEDRVLRPCILWNDGRSAKETAWLNAHFGKRLPEMTANIAFPGFTAPKILWMKNNEPQLFEKIAKIMLPKDYINYLLTGVHACDYSDAAGMLLLDVKNKRWSPEMLEACGITEAQLPLLFESADVIGTVKPEVASALGLPENTAVAAGAGDNAAAAVGNGVAADGACNLSIGTSGTVFIAADRFCMDEQNALHCFCSASGGWHLLGCMLSAAACNGWFAGNILGETDFAALQAAIDPALPGRNPVFFLPYLSGERSPLNDVNARGCFIGLGSDTSKEQMLLAVLEGVAFNFRQILDSAGALRPTESFVCGGGAKSSLWLRILANVTGVRLLVPENEQGPAMGASILAMTAAGAFPDVKTACGALFANRKLKAVIEPDPALQALYDERYQVFLRLYPALKPVFPLLQN
ncbi:MAG: xylulokinase [Clostridia bacterium]|nr:xylulokinase [Clostridia bacterium]